MLRPFFDAAMIAPGRHRTFRRTVVAHVGFVALAAWLFVIRDLGTGPTMFGDLLLAVAMVEAAALIGWRLAQLPKSQALEFLLVSPVQPKRLYLAEALVGASRFLLVWLSALPVYLLLVLNGDLEAGDLWPLFAMPAVWGLAVSALVTAWVYESVAFRRIGEIVGLLGVLVYLVVGVLAAENILTWLSHLPTGLAKALYSGILFFHEMNPFGVMHYWFGSGRIDWIAEERVLWVTLAGVAIHAIAWTRAAFRLKGHFHDRHYTSRSSNAEPIGDRAIDFATPLFPVSFRERPLSWWAVKRVMEYSGRVNVYLAGGFSIVYSAYLIAGEHWPSWMGKLVFELFERSGGAPTIATALCVLAVVPAVFQFGLWDSTVQNRCQRLELLLLTGFRPADYWHASFVSALKRGRAYLVISCWLWMALTIAGRIEWYQLLASVAGACALWFFGFAVGFRSFSSGHQTSGLASLFTLGQPMAVFACYHFGWNALAALIPLGLCHAPMASGWTWTWGAGLILLVGSSIWLTRTGLKKCDAELRSWYDAHQGQKSAG